MLTLRCLRATTRQMDRPRLEEKPRVSTRAAERLWDKEKALAIRERCVGKEGKVSEEKKPTKQIAPQLYDLTTLRREAPFTAKNTLGLAQALYERHKMLTYPRTDSAVARGLHEQSSRDRALSRQLRPPNFELGAITIEDRKFNKRIFNNAKVSDHFAVSRLAVW